MGRDARDTRFTVATAWAVLLCIAVHTRSDAGEPAGLSVDEALHAISSASAEERLRGIRALGADYASAGRSVLVLVDLASLDSVEQVRAAAHEELARIGATGTKALIERLFANPDAALLRAHKLFTDYLDRMCVADLTIEAREEPADASRLVWMALGAEPDLARQMAPVLAYVALNDSTNATQGLARAALAHWGLAAVGDVADRGPVPSGLSLLLRSDFEAVRWMAARLLATFARRMDNPLCLQLATAAMVEGPAAAAAAGMALAEVQRTVPLQVIEDLVKALERQSSILIDYAPLMAAITLGRLGATEQLRRLIGIPTRSQEIRFVAAVGLSFTVDPTKSDLAPLIGDLADRFPQVEVTCEALRRVGRKAAHAAPRLSALAQTDDVWTRVFAARALVAVDPKSALAPRVLAENLETPWGGLAAQALGHPELVAAALPALIAALEHDVMKAPMVRAISVLGPRGAAAVPVLMTSLELELATVGKVPAKSATPLDHIRDIPYACTDEALLCLVRMGKSGRAASGVVTKLLESKSDRTRWRARLALAAMAH
jgi:hypothetical protein